jgi:hypothetical protein
LEFSSPSTLLSSLLEHHFSLLQTAPTLLFTSRRLAGRLLSLLEYWDITPWVI